MATAVARRKVSADSVRQKAVDRMTDPVREKFDKIEKLVADTMRRGIFFYHEIGEELIDLKNEAKYGDSAIKLVEEALMDRSLIYRSILLAEWLSKKELTEILNRPGGDRLSWSHFVSCLPIADTSQRIALLELALEKRMSVDELRDEVKRRARSGSIAHRQVIPKTVTGGLAQVTNMAHRLRARLGDFEKIVLTPLEDADDEMVTDKVLLKIKETKEEMEGLFQESEEIIVGLDTRYKDLTVAFARRREAEEAAKEEAKVAAKAEKEAKEAKEAEASHSDGPSANGKAGGKTKTKKRKRRPVPA